MTNNDKENHYTNGAIFKFSKEMREVKRELLEDITSKLNLVFLNLEKEIEKMRATYAETLKIYDKYLSNEFQDNLKKIANSIEESREELEQAISSLSKKEDFYRKLFFLMAGLQTIIVSILGILKFLD